MKHLLQPAILVLPLVAALLAVVSPVASRGETRLLVVEAARDTTRGFRAQALPALGRRALTWPHGVITLPDTAAWLEHGDQGLTFELEGERLEAVGAGGRLGLDAGSYEIDTPVYLSDGSLVACLAAGQLEIGADRVIYRTGEPDRDRRGDLLMLGGIILATAVLLRAARRRTRRA